MDHTKYRDFTFSYIISRFHLENIDVPFLSSNGSVVYSSRTSYHAKGLVCNHKNCFAAIRFPSFFCNIRRIAPRVDWTLMERWRKTPAVVSTSMVARRIAALPPTSIGGPAASAGLPLPSLLWHLCRILSSLVESCRTIRLDFCRNLSNDFPCFPISNMR